MPKLTFQWNSVPKLTLGVDVHRLVPKLFRAEVTRVEHRLPQFETWSNFSKIRKFQIISEKALNRAITKFRIPVVNCDIRGQFRTSIFFQNQWYFG